MSFKTPPWDTRSPWLGKAISIKIGIDVGNTIKRLPESCTYGSILPNNYKKRKEKRKIESFEHYPEQDGCIEPNEQLSSKKLVLN